MALFKPISLRGKRKKKKTHKDFVMRKKTIVTAVIFILELHE